MIQLLHIICSTHIISTMFVLCVVHVCVIVCVCVYVCTGSAEMLGKTQGQCSATMAGIEETWTTTLSRE